MAEIIYFKTPEAFSDWLAIHGDDEKEIWVGFYKKKSQLNGITWSESVDSALCYGWIDGIRKTVDEDRYKIRFTPRSINSVWSKVNVDKVKQLIEEGKMKTPGLLLFNKRSNQVGYSSEDKNVKLLKVYEDLIKSNSKAWLFLQDLAPSYKRDSIYWVMSAKKKETQLRRLNILIESSAVGLKIPMFRK